MTIRPGIRLAIDPIAGAVAVTAKNRHYVAPATRLDGVSAFDHVHYVFCQSRRL
ncbi:MAG: hypothetical protein AB7E78_15025 [Porticoccaceae bacterium]